jgi:predicted Na+-dependent transporter
VIKEKGFFRSDVQFEELIAQIIFFLMRIRNKRSYSEADARPGRIVISIIFIQFLLHLFYALISKDPQLLMPHLVAWLPGCMICFCCRYRYF